MQVEDLQQAKDNTYTTEAAQVRSDGEEESEHSKSVDEEAGTKEPDKFESKELK